MALLKFYKENIVMEVPMKFQGDRIELEFKGSSANVKSLIASGFCELNENNNEIMGDYPKHRYLYWAQVEGRKYIITNDPKDIRKPQPHRTVGIELIGRNAR